VIAFCTDVPVATKAIRVRPAAALLERSALPKVIECSYGTGSSGNWVAGAEGGEAIG
jgi:hypothetical protein